MSLSALKTAVTEKIAACMPSVQSLLISKMVDEEVNKRVRLLEKAIDVFNLLEKEVKSKSKPDLKQYNGDGSLAAETFSAKAWDDLTKSKAKLKKIQEAIDGALTNANFDTLVKVTAEVGGGSGKSENAGNS